LSRDDQLSEVQQIVKMWAKGLKLEDGRPVAVDIHDEAGRVRITVVSSRGSAPYHSPRESGRGNSGSGVITRS
jgi:hypothetical protein